jgi:hypothetical protein
MATPPEAPNPFGEMGRDARDHIRPPKTVGQAASGLIGFCVMALGGAIVVGGVVARIARAPIAIFIVILGVVVCYFGYWLYGRSQRRVRHGRSSSTAYRDKPSDRPPPSS